MATNGIQVPVSLYIENLQKIINDLKGQLGNLKVGSSGFKAMENHIRTLQKELDKFQIQASKPFIAEGQFVAAEKSVTKLEDEIDKISLTASRLKFSDLELNGEQKAQLKAVEDQINAIKASLKAAKDEAKKNFLSSDLGKQWIDLNPSEATRTLDQITNNIRKAIDDQNKQVQRAKETVDEYKRTITMGDIAQNVAKSTKGLKSDKSSVGLEALMGKEFSDFFTKRANGDVAGFKTGQRGFFAEWLTKNFTIDPTIVKDLVSKTAPEIARVLNDAQSTIRQELNKVIANADTAKVNLPAANVAVSDAEAKVQALIPYLQQAMQATDGLKISEDSLREALAAAGITLENTKESIAANVRGSQEWSNVNQRATAELENLKNTLSQTNAQFLQQQRVTQNFNAMKMAVVNFMGFRQVLNLTKNAIREAINHIKELDSVMNKISIVTNMSTEDLWQQVDQYSKMAQAYGTTIKGAYEVSQIYYQQGLETNDVLTLTNETLKLAKVSGLDYATTTDYMTTALRGFKMEMSEASKVVDVYSNLAAHTAVSSEELAVAMSKTASSMESVGSTFEETSAMIGTMVAVTRESATNIGSALKSIASRYGEMKQDPLKLVDSEGDEISYNKVDAALQSVGITMKTVDGQFRSFTEVILELSEKWDQLESTQQRYIATQFAGNRQQSRFLALVSNPQLLKANLGYAEESEDTGTLQALKALDSIESKLNQVQVAYQQFYTTMGVENVWKGFLDGAKNVINTLNGLPKLFGKLPIGAIQIIYDIIHLAKSALISGLQSLASTISGAIKQSQEPIEQASEDGVKQGKNWMERVAEGMRSGIGGVRAAAQQAMIEAAREIEQKKVNSIEKLTTTANRVVTGAQQISADPTSTHADEVAAAEKMQMIAAQARSMGIAIPHLSGDLDTMGQTLMSNLNPALDQAKEKLKDVGSETLTFGQKIKAGTQGVKDFAKKSDKLSSQFGGIASGLNTLSMLFDTTTRGGQIASGGMMALSGAFRAAGAAAEYLKNGLNANVYIMAAMAIVSVINGIAMAIETPQEKLERLIQEAETLNNKSKEAKANYRTLDNSIKKLDELQEKRYESAEAAEEYQTAVDELAEKFPQMITGFNAAGEVIIDTTSAEELLAAARKKTAKATYEAAQGELNAAKQQKVTATSDIRKHAETLQRDLGDMASNLRYELANIASKNIDFSTAEGQDYLKNIQELYKKAQDTYQDVDFSKLDGTFKSLISAIESQIDSINAIQGYQKATIGAWQQTLNGYEYIEKSSAAVALVTNTINKDFENYSQSHNNQQFDINSTNYDYIVKQAGGHDPIESMNSFWSSLSEEEERLFEKMFSESNNYTVQDFAEVFSDKDNWLSIQQILNDYYLPGVQSMRTRLNALLAKSLGKQADEQGKYEEIVELDDKLSDFYSNFWELYGTSEDQFVDNLTQTETKFLSNVIKYHDQIRDNGYTNRAETFGNSALKLFNEIQNAPYDIEQQLWQLVTENSITTLEGINKIKDGMRNMGYDNAIVNKALDTLQNNIIPNINLEIQSATSNLLDTWEDTSKDLSKALSGGVTLKEADQLIAKAKSLGLENFDLSQFQLAGDKLVLLSNSFDSYYEKLTEYITSSTTAWQGRIDQANKALSAISEFGQSSMPTEILQDYKAALEAIGFTDWSNREYVTQWGTLTEEGKKHIQELIDNTTKELTEYSRATQIAARQLLTAHETSQGIYKLIIDEVEVNLSKDIDKLKTIAQGGTVGGKALDEAAIKKSLNSVYSTLISDVLAKGFENINSADYEGLIQGDDFKAVDSYKDFAQKYAKLAGMNIDETNDLLLKAIEKDRETKAEGLIKDLTFINEGVFRSSRESLTKIANAFDKPIEELITASGAVFDKATQEYIIDIQKLANASVDLTKVDNFKITVQESIDSMFDGLASNIKSALSGSMDSKGTKNLTDTLRQLGLNAELSFTRTKDGYKLATEQVVQLYRELEQVDSITAQIVLDELNKSLDDATIKANGLEKEIAQLRATTESDSFKFMSNKIPSGQNNPLNYFSNWGKAWKTLQDSFKTNGKDKGKIGYEDFYNIISEMGRIAQESGQRINIGAGEFISNAEDAARLIEKGATCLTTATDGSIKVDLTKFGMDFSAGGEEMADNVNTGIKAVAKSQVEMLDSMIQLMETIVAMQELGKIDIDKDNILDIGEIFKVKSDDRGFQLNAKYWTEFTDSFKTVAEQILGNKDLEKSLKDITVNGKTLHQMFQAAINGEGLKDLGIDAESYTKIMNSFYQAAISGNYDPDNIIASIKEVLAGTDFEGELTIGENTKITIHAGAVLQQDEKGNYIVNGKTYTDIDTAAKVYKASNLSVVENALTKEVNEETGEVTYTFANNTKVVVQYNEDTKLYEATIGNTKVTSNSQKGIETAIASAAKIEGKKLTSEEDVTFTIIQEGKADVKVVVTPGGQVTATSSEGQETAIEQAVQEVILPKESIPVSTTIDQIKVKLAETSKVDTSDLNLPDIDYDKVINCIIQLLELKKSGESFEQLPGDVIPENLDSQELSVVITALNLIKSNENGEAWQKTDDVKPEDLKQDALNVLISALKLIWADGANHEPDTSELGISNEYNAPDATITQKVELKWEFKGENNALNQKATEIYGLLSEYDFETEYNANTNQTKFHLGRVEPGSVGPTAEEIARLKEAVQLYELLGGARYKLEGNTVIEFSGELNTEEVDEKIQEYENTNISVPTTLETPDTSNISNLKVPTKIIPTKLGSPTNGAVALTEATGNVGNAKAQGTLMGELGPELVVSNGHYFVAGQNGAEFVNLDTDAIVFNHLQTKALLEKGMSNSRGKAVTSEKNAISYATGNVNGGPAKASASAALAALKQLRAQWQALAGLSVKDLAGKGGGGGGGKNDPKAFIKDLEKWYNWLQRIAVLEQKINYEEQLRSKLQSDMIAHGREYAQSQLDTLPYLKEQAAINKSLYESQEAYFEKRRAEMNDASNPFTSLYTFDEYGQLKYKDGALAQLSELVGRDSLTGQANYTAAEQYEKLVAMGYGKYMEYDSSGNKIDQKEDDWQVNAVQAFWDKIDADQEEMQSLHDSVEEHKNAMLQAQEKQNEILKAIEDNQIAVEDKVLKAIEETRQREIDELQKERDAIEESSKNLIDGLSNQLQKERDMYSRQKETDELEKLQRHLAILQRSGGSASQIASLQSQISDQMQDKYFDEQEKQINTLQEASDNQLERLDRQIDLMTEQLAYEKENGLLWNQVYEVMSGTPEQITEFITSHDSQYWGESPTKLTQDTREILFEAGQFVQFREKVEGGLQSLIEANSDSAVAELADQITAEAETTSQSNTAQAITAVEKTNTTQNNGDKKKNPTKKIKGYKITGTYLGNTKTVEYTDKDTAERAKVGLEKVGWKDIKIVPTYDTGGLVPEDQYALVHAKEGILTAAQTSVLRNDILGNKPNSLLNLLMDFRDAYERIPSASAYDSIGTSTSGIVIENATVEMNVSKIANDYDAQRAGEQALEKMLQIARKTSAQNRIGR